MSRVLAMMLKEYDVQGVSIYEGGQNVTYLSKKEYTGTQILRMISAANSDIQKLEKSRAAMLALLDNPSE